MSQILSIAVALFFVLLYLQLSTSQNISAEPYNLEVLEGGKIVLTCHVTNYKPSYHLLWHRKDGNFSNVNRTTQILTADGKKILEITSAQIEDAGRYFCSVQSDELKDFKITLASTVTVLFSTLNKYPLCAFSQYLGQLLVGTPVFLTCQYPLRDYTHKTSLLWEKGDQEKVDGEQWTVVNAESKIIYSYLNFTAKEDLHDAIFTCTYHNESIRIENQVCHIGPIGVHSTVSVSPEKISVEPGKQTEFTCIVKNAEKELSYTWKIIPPTSLIETQTKNNGATLVLIDISSELSGNEYDVECTAKNKVSTMDARAHLHIKSKSVIEESSSKEEVILPVGIAVLIVCFIFLLIFVVYFVTSKRKNDHNGNENSTNNTTELNNSTGIYTEPAPRAQANPYAIVNPTGQVVNLPPEESGAYANKSGEFIKDDVELIVKE